MGQWEGWRSCLMDVFVYNKRKKNIKNPRNLLKSWKLLHKLKINFWKENRIDIRTDEVYGIIIICDKQRKI